MRKGQAVGFEMEFTIALVAIFMMIAVTLVSMRGVVLPGSQPVQQAQATQQSNQLAQDLAF